MLDDPEKTRLDELFKEKGREQIELMLKENIFGQKNSHKATYMQHLVDKNIKKQKEQSSEKVFLHKKVSMIGSLTATLVTILSFIASLFK